jgi:hypothetical protein
MASEAQTSVTRFLEFCKAYVLELQPSLVQQVGAWHVSLPGPAHPCQAASRCLPPCCVASCQPRPCADAPSQISSLRGCGCLFHPHGLLLLLNVMQRAAPASPISPELPCADEFFFDAEDSGDACPPLPSVPSTVARFEEALNNRAGLAPAPRPRAAAASASGSRQGGSSGSAGGSAAYSVQSPRAGSEEGGQQLARTGGAGGLGLALAQLGAGASAGDQVMLLAVNQLQLAALENSRAVAEVSRQMAQVRPDLCDATLGYLRLWMCNHASRGRHIGLIWANIVHSL